MKIEMDKSTYIGDGVYAEFDGYGIWLKANVPTTDEIYLEPEVLKALNRFYKSKCEEKENE
jgi:hypothetical protein